ncbi:MAG: hypothetical protein KatS3mg061_1099 [Dehalococcoidia bacterium]|nr:MAG: hypothetical protein KatS3mg061_1099 [Dehalococcoidia bacterium]
MPDQRFGRYLLRERLGSSASGEVYRAVLAGDQLPVAVRLLPRSAAADLGLRLEAIAPVLATLRHPALHPALDWGVEGGQPFLVTTLEPGVPLVQANPLALDLSARVWLVWQLAEALQEVHARGLVHGDLRPANLALREGNRLGVMDVALAALLACDPRAGPAWPYLSPEAARSGLWDAAADCYALGVLLYQLLSGVIPCRGASVGETASLRQQLPPPPSQVRPEVPRALDQIALRLLAPRPEERYSTLAEVAQALLPFLGGAAALAEQRQPLGSGPPALAAATASALADPAPARIPASVPAVPTAPASAPNEQDDQATASPAAPPTGEATSRARCWSLGGLPRVGIALTALALTLLATATLVGAGHAAVRTAAVGHFLPPPPPALPAAPTPSRSAAPVIAALPPPAVISTSAGLTVTSVLTPLPTATVTLTGPRPTLSPTAVPTASGGVTTSGRSGAVVTPTLAPPLPPQSDPNSLLYLVSRQRGVPESYQPADLVPLEGVVKTLKPELRIRRTMLDAFRRLIEAMRAAGLEPAVAGAYRSPAEQRALFSALIAQHGQSRAEQLTPKPGYDEHQLGTVVDFVSASQGYSLDDRFDESPEGRWLKTQAARYGFIQSAPPGKEPVLGFKAAPWQYRYVGELAYDIAARGQTLEEYLTARRPER